MKWITRERPKIDRIACPWLIKRFVDPDAEFIFVPKEMVFQEAGKQNAIPYDIPGAEYSHYGEECTFDYVVRKHGLTDPAIQVIAIIVRGADTDRFELAPEAAGFWAISAGLSRNYADDHAQLEIGMKIYDALYSWAAYARDERHNWDPDLLPPKKSEI
ncbi:chromate resistance protein ChrB domain-containing protein [Chitinophaga sp. NPDC101104]|uniref:chromate resistance protein ChrB domain-containing protein n=1 Tax=Chitinophaga sp. NPDC101104 TaxID=3390561 RepID=UPI003CFDCDC7